jgi:hypothetical protein
MGRRGRRHAAPGVAVRAAVGAVKVVVAAAKAADAGEKAAGGVEMVVVAPERRVAAARVALEKDVGAAVPGVAKGVAAADRFNRARRRDFGTRTNRLVLRTLPPSQELRRARLRRRPARHSYRCRSLRPCTRR